MLAPLIVEYGKKSLHVGDNSLRTLVYESSMLATRVCGKHDSLVISFHYFRFLSCFLRFLQELYFSPSEQSEIDLAVRRLVSKAKLFLSLVTNLVVCKRLNGLKLYFICDA